MGATESIVVVGAGQAGDRAVRTLRAEGFVGNIDLVGEEPHPPYERPPLSKSVLVGKRDDSVTFLGAGDAYAELGIRWRPGVRVKELDRESRSVLLSSLERLHYDRLILATGSRARTLGVPGANHPRIAYLRSLEDCYSLRRNLSASRRVVIVGGGWIGLEVAASARELGLSVTLLEAGDRLCSRSLPTEVSELIRHWHRQRGVDIRLGETVSAVRENKDGRLVVVSGRGESYPADTMVVGIGAVPNDELARDAGLAVDNGILTDACGRTEDPCVFACGDVSNYYNEFLGRRVRLESWSNANNQAVAAARAAMCLPGQNDVVPWFWSEQYGMVVQILGMPEARCDCFVRGDIESGSFTRFYIERDTIRTVVAVNRAADVPASRRLMEHRLAVDPERLVDQSVPLKKLLKRQ
ncbi:MAG: pyridine nucleotide-disulfide oxidoreductase [Proteobacteria bacterium]|nr:MAG: pyridine nucleotide-disulfide oxidoreductase [Pseudomonadota bacterium]